MFLLVDCNNFFVSCERVFNPALQNRPVVVLSNNDGCIIARSNEVKALGVPMGAPLFQWEAFLRAHQVTLFSSNFELYGDMSARVMRIIADNAETYELYSIDEAFIRVSDRSESSVLNFAKALREQILRETGIPVSIGVAPSKTLAKLAAELAKQQRVLNGVASLFDRIRREKALNQFSVGSIWGVGRQWEAALSSMGILTAKLLAESCPRMMRKRFNVLMEKMIYELRGIACFPIQATAPRKQIISSRSFSKPITESRLLYEAVSHYAAIASEKLRSQQSRVTVVGVFLKGEGMAQSGSDVCYLPFSRATADTAKIIQQACAAAKQLYRPGRRYKKAGVILLHLQSCHGEQEDCFSEGMPAERVAVMHVLDEINARFGRGTVFHLAEGVERPWRSHRARCSACYTTRWDELLRVS